MSVSGLAITTANVYSVINTQDITGALFEGFTLKYSNIPVRTMYTGGEESVINGKIQVIPNVRIYFPTQYTLVGSDIIEDCVNGDKYDILNIYEMDYRRHMQVDCKRTNSLIETITYYSTSSDSSSSSSLDEHNSSSSSSSSSLTSISSSSDSSQSNSSESTISYSSQSDSSGSTQSRSSESSSSSSSSSYGLTSESSESSSSLSSMSSRSSVSNSSESTISYSSQSDSSGSTQSRSSESSSSSSSSSYGLTSESSESSSSLSSMSSRSSASYSSESTESYSSQSDSSKSSMSKSSSVSSSSSSSSEDYSDSSSSSTSSSEADYVYVSGDAIPDAEGTYTYDGLYHGTCSYKRLDGSWYIYFQAGSNWIISSVKGSTVPYSWRKTGYTSACVDMFDGAYTMNVGTQGSLRVFSTQQSTHSSSSSSSSSNSSSSYSSSSSSSSSNSSSSSSSSSSYINNWSSSSSSSSSNSSSSSSSRGCPESYSAQSFSSIMANGTFAYVDEYNGHMRYQNPNSWTLEWSYAYGTTGTYVLNFMGEQFYCGQFGVGCPSTLLNVWYITGGTELDPGYLT